MKTLHRFAATLLAAASLAAVAAEPMYPAVDRAKADVDAAMKEAKKAGKRVLVDFGGNWCTDCKILDINLKKPENASMLESYGFAPPRAAGR